jgi:hypothetical protein
MYSTVRVAKIDKAQFNANFQAELNRLGGAEMHTVFAWVGAAIAVIAYIPLTRKVWKSEIEQNFSTYLLWGLLDLVAGLSTFAEYGNWALPTTYVACCSAVLIAIWRTKTFKWGWVETMTTIFVMASIIVWYFQGPVGATVVSTLGVVAASVPQLIDIVKKPKDAPVVEYIFFTLANGVSIFAGRDWTVSERFYSASCTVLTFAFVLIGLRKYTQQLKQHA